MKGISNSFLRTICALVIGLILVMFPNEAGDYLVITIGVVFLIPSLLSIIGYFAMTAEERRRLPIEGIGSLLFGLWLIIMPGFFADLLTFVLGFILGWCAADCIAFRSPSLDAGSCGVLYHSGPYSDCRTDCVVQSDGSTFHGVYHYWYHQHSVCSFRIDQLVHIYSQTAEGTGYAGSFFKGCRQY